MLEKGPGGKPQGWQALSEASLGESPGVFPGSENPGGGIAAREQSRGWQGRGGRTRDGGCAGVSKPSENKAMDFESLGEKARERLPRRETLAAREPKR